MEVTGGRRHPGDPSERPGYVDQDDFARFSHVNRPRLEQWLRRRGLSPHDAADVAQDVLVGLSMRWPHLKTEEHRRRSYFTISNNTLADFWRQRERRAKVEVPWDDERQGEMVADARTSDPDVLFGEGHPSLWNAMQGLSEPRRDAVVGRVVHRMSYEELAAATGRSTHALRQDVARGLAWLRRVLSALSWLLGAAAVRGRRGSRATRTTATNATASVLAVVPQGALLSLLVTAPLYVLPEARAVTEVVAALRRGVVATLPRPVNTVVAVTVAGPGSLAHAVPDTAASDVLDRLRRAPAVVVDVSPLPRPLDPRTLCPRARCGTGSRIVVTVLGQQQGLPGQSYVETCWAVPAAAAPHVTCSETP